MSARDESLLPSSSGGLRYGEGTNLSSVQEEAGDQIDSVFDLDDDFNGDFSEANAPSSGPVESIQDVADVVRKTPQNGSDCKSDDIAEVSVPAHKRKAEELDDGQDATQGFSGSEEGGVAPPVAGSSAPGARSVFGVHSTGESVET
ncbi:hypothetical protein BGX31_005721, partial [Mortierella sp. GBA43]